MSELTPPAPDDLTLMVDGRLSPADMSRVAAWLASHPEEAERMDQHRRINDALHQHFDGILDEPVPARLREVFKRRAWPRLARAAAWAAIGLATGLVGGWLFGEVGSEFSRQSQTTLPMRAALVHATYSPEVRHPVEVGADQEAHLSAWLSKRLGQAINPPKLDHHGFALVGGRLLPGEADSGRSDAVPPPAAHFMYQCNMGRRVTLYVRPGAFEHQETALRHAREVNVNVVYWSDRRMGYALSSTDLGREELQRIADAAYRQINP